MAARGTPSVSAMLLHTGGVARRSPRSMNLTSCSLLPIARASSADVSPYALRSARIVAPTRTSSGSGAVVSLGMGPPYNALHHNARPATGLHREPGHAQVTALPFAT